MTKQQFQLYFDPDPDRLPPHTTRRPATPEERRFLRRYNLIRLLRIFFFWFGMLSVLGLVAGVNVLFFTMALHKSGADKDFRWIISALMILPVLVLDWIVMRQWGKQILQTLKTRPLLTVPDDLEIVQFSANWGALVHATGEETNIFMADQMTVDLPGHWEDQVVARMNASQGMLRPQIALARLPGAHNRIIRLPLRAGNGHRRTDILLRDFGNIVVGWDDLSSDREMRARMPVLRANPDLIMPVLLAAGLGVLFYLASSVMVEMPSADTQQVKYRISGLTQQHLGGSEVDIEALARRGFTGLTAVPGHGGRIVTADPFDIVPADQGPDQNALYLRPEELAPIARLENVFPLRFPDSGAPDAETIAEYRVRLEERVTAPSTLGALQAMPDGLVAMQLMAQANTSRAAPDFIKALLPAPSIEAEDPSGFAVPPPIFPCKQIGPICAAKGEPRRWQKPAFKTIDGRIRLFDATELDRLAQLKEKLAWIESGSGPRYMRQAMIAAFSIGALIWMVRWSAARRLKRYYRSN